MFRDCPACRLTKRVDHSERQADNVTVHLQQLMGVISCVVGVAIISNGHVSLNAASASFNGVVMSNARCVNVT